MTYNANIPQPTDNLSVSQGQLLGNFMALDSIFNLDHFTWDDTTNGGAYRGFHRKITLPVVQPSDPATPVSSVLYTKTVTNAELFFKNAANVVTQLTGLPQNIVNNGSYTFPGGLIIKFGTQLIPNSGPNVGKVVYGTPFPTQTFSIVITGNNFSSEASKVDAFTNAGFTSNSNINGNIFYISIGN